MEIRCIGFRQSGFDMRKTAHRSGSMGPCCEKFAGADEEVANVASESRFSGRSPANTHRRIDRWITNDCIRAGFCMDPNSSNKWRGLHIRETIHRVRPGSFDLQSCPHANRCHIDNMSRTSPVSRRESFRGGSVWIWLWHSSQILGFRRNIIGHPAGNARSILVKTLESSGLPVAMGKESLQAFLGDWKVHPLQTFRQGFRRTWIVRATEHPTETTAFPQLNG